MADHQADRHTLALIAHDGKKADLVAWATYNRTSLAEFNLVATATTGSLLRDKVGLPAHALLSGPMGGNAQIAAMVAEGRVRAVFFFVDPLRAREISSPGAEDRGDRAGGTVPGHVATPAVSSSS